MKAIKIVIKLSADTIAEATSGSVAQAQKDGETSILVENLTPKTQNTNHFKTWDEGNTNVYTLLVTDEAGDISPWQKMYLVANSNGTFVYAREQKK